MSDDNLNSDTKEVKAESSYSFIEISKYIPIAYPILIFLGYINYDFYYRKFSVDIFNYLSINEFLFSFISLIYPVMIFLIAYYSYSIYNDLMLNTKKKDNENSKNKKKDDKPNFFEKHSENHELKHSIYLSQYYKSKYEWNKRNFLKSIGYFILMILLFLLFIIESFLPIAIIYYSFVTIILPLQSITKTTIQEPNYLDEPRLLLMVILFGYIGFAIILGLRHMKGIINRKTLRVYLIGTFFITVLSTLMQYQNLRSYNFTQEKPTKEVCFVYENENIKTSKTKKLLGITANYIFLRDDKIKTNYIYKLSEVRHLKISSLELTKEDN
jgi:hypothetical protein